MILVRTVIELVKNKNYYVNECSRFVGPFDKALQRTCNNNRFCEFYEIVALANVLRCEVQSVYPYIDYRADMEIMNATYKPITTSVSNNTRVVIFWTNTKYELAVKSRPACGSVWSPNHFVPLISGNRPNRTETIEAVILTPKV